MMCVVIGVLRQGHLRVHYVKATSVMMCMVTGVLRQGHRCLDGGVSLLRLHLAAGVRPRQRPGEKIPESEKFLLAPRPREQA